MIRTIIYIVAAASAVAAMLEGFWSLQETNPVLANVILTAWTLAGVVLTFSIDKREKSRRR
jgi:hypothetical protein